MDNLKELLEAFQSIEHVRAELIKMELSGDKNLFLSKTIPNLNECQVFILEAIQFKMRLASKPEVAQR